jgi:hypothetical protein
VTRPGVLTAASHAVARSADVGQDGAMTASSRGPWRASRFTIALVLALSCAVGAIVVSTPSDVSALSRWTGGVNLYRSGVYTVQKTWLWCTAADIQIMRNIVRGTNDHSTKNQRTYFNWMRKHNRYDLPLSAGVDAQGWAAGMRHFIDGRYRLIASKTFTSALRLAVIRLRKTNLPVGITVSRGNHAWILTGFRATADPAKTRNFKVTSVRVVGPLYGKQSKNGYDMKPNTKLTVAQFRKFFTPWRYAPKRMIWDGLYVSIQPVTPKKKASTTATAGTSQVTDTASLSSPRIAAWVGPSLAASLAVSVAARRVRGRRVRGLRARDRRRAG